MLARCSFGDTGDVQNYGVVGGVICDGQRVLLVKNQRRDGRFDWSPPGGIVDPGETLLDALSREVAEETALNVDGWSDCVYRVAVDFVDLEAALDVTVFAARRWSGQLHVDDPDQVVVDAGFFARETLAAQLAATPRWVREPLLEWVKRDAMRPPLPIGTPPPMYRYRAQRDDAGRFHVEVVDS